MTGAFKVAGQYGLSISHPLRDKIEAEALLPTDPIKVFRVFESALGGDAESD
jgi:hypothetical protein